MGLEWFDICKVFFAVIFPPIGVLMERGIGADLCINILLTILGYIPGTYIHNKYSLYSLIRYNSRIVHHSQVLVYTNL